MLPLARFMKESCKLGSIEFVGHTGYIDFYPGRTCVDGIRSIDSIDFHRLFADAKDFAVEDGDALITAFGRYSWIVSFLGEMQSLRVFISTECDEQLKNAFLDEFEDFPQLDNDDALDAAAFTCDPAIAESYAPMFNTYAQGRQWRQRRREPITRHSGW